MADLSPQFPLHFTDSGGYASNTTVIEVVRQNFKNLILTSPGERVMLPDFGVGIRNYLFEQNTDEAVQSMLNRTKQQIKNYMPFIEIEQFSPEYDENELFITIRYKIIPLDYADILRVTV